MKDTKPAPVLPEHVTRQQTAKCLKVSVQTVDKLLRQNALTAYHVGRCVRLRLDEVLAYLEGRRAQ